MMNLVSVIIPFYQKEAGVLKRSLESVFKQTAYELINEIIVVDDSSPISAESEFETFNEKEREKLRLINQENSGPGGARNTGLESVNHTSTYIAFLDSDDIWEENHIKIAIKGLDKGNDFYFANFFQIGQKIAAFERAGKLNLEQHEELSLDDSLYLYNGDFRKQIITGNLIGTPTVVFRRSAFENIRFDKKYKNAGEDYLFWLRCSDVGKRIIFCAKPQCRCEKGINVFAGAQWGTKHLQERLYFEMLYKKEIIKRYQSLDIERGVALQLKSLRKQYFLNLLSLLKQGQLGSLLLSFSHLRSLL